MPDNYENFKSQVFSLTKIDLNAYKEAQMKRRIDSLIAKERCKSYSEYYSLIQKNTEKREEFIAYLTINVSEFWRNPEQWIVLEQKVVPSLLKVPSFKIWSAACSTGDEPYSIVMLLSKYLPLNRIKVIATDIDKQILEKAKSGLYHEKSLKGLPSEFVTKYFEPISDSSFQIKDEIKKCVEFRQHDLLRDEYPSGCDLIVCRNVLIYFTEEAKDEIYARFNKALKSDGILFLGSTEQIISPTRFGFSTISSFFYKKNN